MPNSGGVPRVLVVEDDESVRLLLDTILRPVGIEPIFAVDGQQALEAIDRDAPALVVLDLGLPDVVGHDLIRTIRNRSEIPIVVLSARSSEADRVLALELGADDYVGKPFTPNELVARVRVRLRRPPAQVGVPAVPDGPGRSLVVDPLARTVTFRDVTVDLTVREFDLLTHFVNSPRRVFSRAELLDAVWGSNPDWQGEATVTEHVHRLRRKLGPGAIVTVRGVGYRYDPDDFGPPGTPGGPDSAT